MTPYEIQDMEIRTDDVVRFVRLLGELNASGLTDEQFLFLSESAELDREEVESILERADEMYEAIKDAIAHQTAELPVVIKCPECGEVTDNYSYTEFPNAICNKCDHEWDDPAVDDLRL